MNVIEIKSISKIFTSGKFSKESITALDNVSFNVEKGNIYGLLGPNGAGKTTLVKILLNIVFANDGTAMLNGKNIIDYSSRESLGYLPENHKFPNFLTGIEVLKYLGELSGVSKENLKTKIPEVLSLVDMDRWGKTKIKKYSKGMLQRIGLAQVLINDPEILFLDEPTDGVDPLGRKQIRDILIDLKSKGKTILLNSHLLSEIELICDKVAILDKGKLLKEGTINELTITENTYRFITSELEQNLINELLATYKVIIENKNSFLINSSDIKELNNFIDFCRNKKILIHSIVKEKSTLEDMFINLIEHQN